MLKIFLLSGAYGRDDIIKILNDWLAFMIRYCSTDIKYLEQAAKKTEDPAVRGIVNDEEAYVARLLKTALTASDENLRIFNI